MRKRDHPIFRDMAEEHRPPEFVRSVVCVPLGMDGPTVGTLVAHKEVANGFTQHHLHLLESMAVRHKEKDE